MVRTSPAGAPDRPPGGRTACVRQEAARRVGGDSDMTDQLAGFGATFDHAAVAAHRIRDLLPIYYDLLGGTFLEGGDNQRVGYRAVQLSYPNDTRIELMEPLGGSHFFDSFFARRGTGGVHHLTFKVDDIEGVVEELRRRGYSLAGLFLEDRFWREVFLHPREAYGTLVQLAQLDESAVPPRGLSLDLVLSGHGQRGNGVPSP